MQDLAVWIRAHKKWLVLSVLEPLVVLLLIFLFQRDYFDEFQTKAGFEVLAIGAALQLIGVGFVIPYSEVAQKPGIGNWLLKVIFVALAFFCIVSTNVIYMFGPGYLLNVEARYMR